MKVKIFTAIVTFAISSCYTLTVETMQEQTGKADANVIRQEVVNKTIYVILFNPYTNNEGIHTIFLNGRNKVLMFESAKEANNFAKKLIEEKPKDLNIPTPFVEAFSAKEIIDFCQINKYDYELIAAKNKVILPPKTWVDNPYLLINK